MKNYNAVLENKHFLDFNPIYFGYCQSKPDSLVDFGIRSHFLLQYVISGKGVLVLNGKHYPVTKKQLFLVPPGTTNYHVSDNIDPWSTIWIAFKGNMVEKFCELPPVIDFHSNLFFEMMQAKEMDNMKEEFLVQKLFELYTILFRTKTPVNYVSAVENYIQNDYMNSDISIAQIAESLNLNHSHLSRLFKKETGISIQDYLTNTRMSRAISLLEGGENVQNTARQVGYTDTFNFSRAFKRHTGTTPSSRKQNHK